MSSNNTDTQLMANSEFLLKNVYEPWLVRMIFEEDTLYGIMEKRPAKLSAEGDQMLFSVQTDTVESFRATQEDGSLARPTVIGGFQASIPKKIHTASIQFTHMGDLWTRSQRAAYANTKKRLVEEMGRGFKRKMNEQFYLYGAGVFARVNGAPDLVTGIFTVDDELTAASGVTFGTKYARRYVRFQASANKDGSALEKVVDGQIENVYPATLQIQAKGPMPGLADNDFLFYEGSKNMVTDGLMSIIDNGSVKADYLGVNRVTQPLWASQVTTFPVGGLVENELAKLANRIRSSPAGGMDGTLKSRNGWVLLTTPGVVQTWWEQLSVDRRYMIETMTRNAAPVLPAGYTDMYMWTPVTGPLQTKTNTVCPTGHGFLMFFNDNIWHLAQTGNPGWYDDYGGIFSKVRGTFLVEGTWYWCVEVVCTRPDLQGKLTDVPESV